MRTNSFIVSLKEFISEDSSTYKNKNNIISSIKTLVSKNKEISNKYSQIKIVDIDHLLVSPHTLSKCVNYLSEVAEIVTVECHLYTLLRRGYFAILKNNINNKYLVNFSILIVDNELLSNNTKHLLYSTIKSIKEYCGESQISLILTKEGCVDNETYISEIISDISIEPLLITISSDTEDQWHTAIGNFVINNNLYNRIQFMVNTNADEHNTNNYIKTKRDIDTVDECSTNCSVCPYISICSSSTSISSTPNCIFLEDRYNTCSSSTKKVYYSKNSNIKILGIRKKLKKAVKKVAKQVKRTVKTVVKIVTVVVITPLRQIGKEAERTGRNAKQITKTLSGEQARDRKRLERQQKRVEKAHAEYNAGVDELVDKMESLIAFHEIFQLSMSNRLDTYVQTNGEILQQMISEYEIAVENFKKEYDFILGLAEGSFLQKIIGSVIMIAGGLIDDFADIISGKTDGNTWKRFSQGIILVIAILAAILFYPLGGFLFILAIIAAIQSFLALDVAYANGALTSALMSSFDFIFNDILNLDDLVGNDFDKFDSDHQDYQEMVGYIKLGMSLAAAVYSFGASVPASAASAGATSTVAGAGAAAATETSLLAGSHLGGSLVIGTTAAQSSFLGVSFSTYNQIYSAYSMATSVGDVISANDQYNKLKDKFNSDITKLELVINTKRRKNFMKHYKDSSYFLQDQQIIIDNYVNSMLQDSMYVDPYGVTPVANMRFTPDSDTIIDTYGFEDMFDESSMAGSDYYFENILYGS